MLEALQFVQSEAFQVFVWDVLVGVVAGVAVMVITFEPAVRRRINRATHSTGQDADFWRAFAGKALKGPDALFAGGPGTVTSPHRGTIVAVREDVTRLEHGATGRVMRRTTVHSTPPIAGVVSTTEDAVEVPEKGWHPADEGRFLVTDWGIGFEGEAGSEMIP